MGSRHNSRSRAGGRLVAGVLVAGMGMGAIPAIAADGLVQSDAVIAAVDAMTIDGGGTAIVTNYDRQMLAPGVELVSVDRIQPGGRLEFDVLVADLGSGSVRADYLYPGTVSDAEPVSDLIENADAIAGVNGSFFDINASKAPSGVGISEEEGIVTVPAGTGNGAITSSHIPVVFTPEGLAAFAGITLTAEVTHNGEPLDLDIAGVNSYFLGEGQIGMFNHVWGDYTRDRALNGGTGTEILINPDGIVTSVGIPATGQLPEGVISLVERDAPGTDRALDAVEVGDQLVVETAVTSEAGEISAAIGANAMLVSNGEPVVSRDTALNPRTAIGFNETGSLMYLLVVDGRQASSTGVTLTDLGVLMKELGAFNAANLDGGGSTSMGAVAPGETVVDTPHNPSDGQERPVPNGIGLVVDRGSGEVSGYSVAPLLHIGDATRVFPGLTRRVQAKGYDETGSAVPGTVPAWSATGAVTVESHGDHTATLTGIATGTDTVVASHGDASGSLNIEVLGELSRIEVSPSVVQLSSSDDVASFTVYGYDKDGYRAPIDAGDVTIAGNEGGAFTIEPGSTGTFAVSANADNASAPLTVDVNGISAEAAVSVGVDTLPVANFEDADQWTAGQARAPGVTVTPADGQDDRGGAAISFDFTQSTGTRGAYAIAPGDGIEIPGQPTALTAWMDGNEHGAWPRIQVRQADGTVTQLDGSAEPFEGWRRVTFAVPSGVDYPLTFQMFRLMETRPAAQYTDSVVVSDIQALVPTRVDLPVVEDVTDSVIVRAGGTDDSPLRIAVVSDAQFVARQPDSGAVQGARESFREILAEDPDLVIINGDFVDEGAPEDFELAQRIIDEELGDFPYVYVPGNHEIMGGDITNFVDAFGATNGYLDVEGTRLVWVNSAPGSLSHDFEQLTMLRRALDDAAMNDDITGVVLFQHHPVDDPLPTKASQMSNRLDAEMLRDWLEDFRSQTGKPIANVAAGVGIFHAMTLDGIPYFINGNAGKGPTGGSSGSFTGWSMIGIDPAASSSPREWISFEVNTRVDDDGLSLGEFPTVLEANGEAITLTPTMSQDDGVRTMPVAWPMSYAWSSDSIHIGDVESAAEGSIAAFDPESNTLTPLSGGEGSLTLTVNTESVTADFTIAPDLVPVTPEKPGFTGNVISIPEVDGVDYLIADKVVTGNIEIKKDTTVTARAAEGYILSEGAQAEWSFALPAPTTGNLFRFPNAWDSTDIGLTIAFGREGDEVIVGDWDGDGQDSIGVRRGKVFYLANELVGGEADASFRYGREGDEVLVGDWDGNGTDTLGVRRGDTFLLMNELVGGDAEITFHYGRESDEVLVGDWDGNSSDTILVRRGRVFFVSNALQGGNAETSFAYGRNADEALPGDFDGDGNDTIALRRGETIFLKNVLSGGPADEAIDFADGAVFVGDWDGDGVDTPVMNQHVSR